MQLDAADDMPAGCALIHLDEPALHETLFRPLPRLRLILVVREVVNATATAISKSPQKPLTNQ